MRRERRIKEEDKSDKSTIARIPPDLRAKIEELLPLLPGYSFNGFVQQAVRQMIDLIETGYSDREVPLLVRQTDAAKTSERFKTTPPSSQSALAAEALMRAKKSTEG